MFIEDGRGTRLLLFRALGRAVETEIHVFVRLDTGRSTAGVGDLGVGTSCLGLRERCGTGQRGLP